MFANIFSFKSKPETLIKSEKDKLIDELNEDIDNYLIELDGLRLKFAALEDENILLNQANQMLEQENAKFGNALVEISQQETPRMNATVKRIVTLAKVALGVVS